MVNISCGVVAESAGGISGSVGFKLQISANRGNEVQLSANPMQLSAMTAQITAHRCNRQQRCGTNDGIGKAPEDPPSPSFGGAGWRSP